MSAHTGLHRLHDLLGQDSDDLDANEAVITRWREQACDSTPIPPLVSTDEAMRVIAQAVTDTASRYSKEDSCITP
jgi:hypothetical protein